MAENSRIGPLLNILVCGLIVAKTEALFVGITLLKDAVAKGAGTCAINNLIKFFLGFFPYLLNCNCAVVCLDGSPPAYHLDKGFGTGINSWLVHFEVGVLLLYIFNIFFKETTICLVDKQL